MQHGFSALHLNPIWNFWMCTFTSVSSVGFIWKLGLFKGIFQVKKTPRARPTCNRTEFVKGGRVGNPRALYIFKSHLANPDCIALFKKCLIYSKTHLEEEPGDL